MYFRSDNGLEFLSRHMQLLLAESGTWSMPTWVYTPTAKGQIEQWNRDAKRYTATFPGSTRGPEDVRGWAPFEALGPVLDLQEVQLLFAQYIYRRDRTPQRGQKLSPLAKYAQGAKPDSAPRLVAEATLARYLMVRETRRAEFVVDRNCIRYRGARWTAKEMALVTADTVEVWYSDIDPDYVEVRAAGFSFQVVRDLEIDEDEADEMRYERDADVARTNRLRAAGAELAADRATTQAAESAEVGAPNITLGATPGPNRRVEEPETVLDDLDEAYRLPDNDQDSRP